MSRGAKGKDRNAERRILAIDIGGSGLKASIVDASGQLLVPRRRIDTPCPCPPSVMLDALADLVAPLPAHNRIAIGFPGVVRGNRIVTAPHFGTESAFRLPRRSRSDSLDRRAW